MAVDREQALGFARYLQDIAQQAGYNVGLTGGCLYKNGERKDMDFIVYPHDSEYSRADFLLNLDDAGYAITEENEWLVKLSGDFDLDLFFMYRAGGGSGPNIAAPTIDPMPAMGASVLGMESDSMTMATQTASQAIEANRQLRRDVDERLNSRFRDPAVSWAIRHLPMSLVRRIDSLDNTRIDTTRRRTVVTFRLEDSSTYSYAVNDFMLENTRRISEMDTTPASPSDPVPVWIDDTV